MTVVMVEPVGWVSSPRREVADDDWGDVRSTIMVDAQRFSPDALRGLEEFSHVEVVFVFDRVDADAVHTGARRPRGNPDWPESASSRSGPRTARTGSASAPAGCLRSMGSRSRCRAWTPSTVRRCSTSSPTSLSSHRTDRYTSPRGRTS